MTLYIESLGYDEYIIFGDYVASKDRVSALSLPHLNHGDLPDPVALDGEPIATVQYIYDSKTNNVLVKDFADEGRKLTTVYTNNPYYRSYAWYSTRRYAEANFANPDGLIARGDQFKIRLDFAAGFRIVVKPDIIYFPHQGKDYVVKSSAMLLPTRFVVNHQQYLEVSRPLTANEAYSLVYLNIGSDNLAIIVHKQRFAADKQVDKHVREGTVSHQCQDRTTVTLVQCKHFILVPENRGDEPGGKEGKL